MQSYGTYTAGILQVGSPTNNFKALKGLNTTPQPFYGPFSGTTRVSRWQKATSRFYGARED